jgi:hypothetical protein
MDTCVRSPDRVFGVHVIGQRNVHGIDITAPKAVIILFIGVSMCDTVPAA